MQRQSDVQSARETAAVNAVAAQDAVINAVIAARLQEDALARVSSQNDLATHAIYATLITSVFGFLSLLASFGWKAFTDNRDHRWLVESTHKTELTTAQHRVTELAKIAEVQESAKAAYTEANTVKERSLSIGLKMADDQPLKPGDRSPA